MTSMKTLLALLAAGAAAGPAPAAGAGLRSSPAKVAAEKKVAAVARLRDLVEADDGYNVLALLREAGVGNINAQWGCACGHEDAEDGDGNGDGAAAAAARCECECLPARVATSGGSDNWTRVRAEDGAEVPCFVGLGVRTGTGGLRRIGTHGSVARKSA